VLIVITFLFLSGCAASNQTETVTVFGAEIEEVKSVNDDIQIDILFRVSKNVKSVRVYYDSWENGWIRLDYNSWQDVPRRDRRMATQIVGVRDSLTVPNNTERIRATIIASNISFDEGFGVSAEKQEIFSLKE
jgi:predicted PP-loop superfamily ATPase